MDNFDNSLGLYRTENGGSMSAGTDIKPWKQRLPSRGYSVPEFGAAVAGEIAELRAALEAAEGDKRKLAEMVKIAIEGMKPDSGRDAAIREALAEIRIWFGRQRKAISKGCGSSWDMGQCDEQIAFIDAAMAAQGEQK